MEAHIMHAHFKYAGGYGAGCWLTLSKGLVETFCHAVNEAYLSLMPWAGAEIC